MKICVRRQLACAQLDELEVSRVQVDFKAKNGAIGVLRALKSAWYTKGMGQNDDRLKSLSDDELLAGLSGIVGR